ncbi:arylsulfotransferase family protein [Streptomyces sp. S.PNR 29]|uniref:arylsulfotransferase family protein n=1 Tax=Streptomyces sp. S.PNR 29 TaxID=2973805 RepID=UPI0025B05113|nr:arylsulfotransferase family protein [Streptomyces sp. S.PNR 29]MDN0194459.1 arylsulfotransferase family protein [Streptomyces sp. S.PNR 29]
MPHRLRTLTALAATALLAVASNTSGTAPAAVAASPAADAPAVLQPRDVATSGVEEPPPVDVLTRRPGRAQGDLFVTAQSPTPIARGPQIMDDHGRPIWFRKLPAGYFAADFRTQEYKGEKVLTWWEGKSTNTGIGAGVGYIANENYEIIATVQTPDPGEVMDLHEFLLTPKGTALILSYQQKPYDLSEVGGPKNGTVVDNVVQEIDIATGKKVMNWSALEHVPLGHSDIRPSSDASVPYDYLHVNSVDVDTDGNLIISGNTASTVYKVDRKTGEIIWRLGGKNSDFRLGVGVRFSWQHDVRAVGGNTYRVFDNATRRGMEGYESRVAWIKVDPRRGRAELVRQQVHPDLMSAAFEGGSQALRNGNTFVSWGVSGPGRMSEFTRDGRLVFDAKFPGAVSSYRAYRLGWEGRPLTKPELLVDEAASGVVHANWNGASEVARWRLLAAKPGGDLKPVATAAWDGFDTPITLPADSRAAGRMQVQALDGRGKVIGSSTVTSVDAAGAAAN